MEIIKIDYDNPDPIVMKKVAKVIHEGNIAIVPGDAVYTIVADAFSLTAVNKIFALKKREKNKAVNLGLYCLEDIAKYGQYDPLITEVAKKYPHEPFTFVVQRKESVPVFLNPGYTTVGFRIPHNKVTSMLSKFHRSPVVGTSANISELHNTYSVEALMKFFGEIFGHGFEPEIVLDAGKLPERRPSTVLQLVDHDIKIIREGEIDAAVLYNEINELAENLKKQP